MTIEQPKFESEPEDLENAERSNVLIGPWPGSGLEARAVPELEPTEPPTEQPTENPVEIEPVTPEPEAPPESELERAEKLETARQKLNTSFDSGSGSFSTDIKEEQKALIPFSEQQTEYKLKVCEKCQGTGRFLFFFKCPICRGLGKISIPDRITSQSGHYEVSKK